MLFCAHSSLSAEISKSYTVTLQNSNRRTIINLQISSLVLRFSTRNTTMEVTSALVFCVVTAVLLDKTHAAPNKDNDADSCFVSLIIPKEKIKSSCDEKGKTNMKMQSLVSEITQLERDIGEINVRITKILSRDGNNEEVKQLSDRVLNLELVKLPDIESRLAAVEGELKTRASLRIPKKRVVKMLKPVLMKELGKLKQDLIAEVAREIVSDPSIATKSYGKQPSGIKSSTQMNQFKTQGQQQQFPQAQSLTSNSYAAGIKTDFEDSTFSKSFNQQLESLARQVQYETDQFQVKSTHHNPPFQADGRFDPRFNQLIEIFKTELTDSLEKQTEKVKGITNRNLNGHFKEVEGKMTQILNIIKGMQNKYDTKLTEIAKGYHYHGNVTGKMEHLESDIKVLASSISALRSNFFADPQIQQLFKQELHTMENKIADTFHNHTESLRKEIVYFDEQMDKHKRDISLARSEFGGYRADLRIKLHYMDENITTLNKQFTVINNTLLYPDYPELDMDEADRYLKISETIVFVDSMKDEWPHVVSNLTHIIDLHVNDIDHIKTDFIDTRRKYDHLKESQINLIEHINTIETTMETFRDSFNQVEKIVIDDTLDTTTWIKYDFNHTFGRTSCFSGRKYVKKTDYKTGGFVGVVLCNETRYKIYLSDSLNDTFLDIGDAHLHGEDHCEFVGANRTAPIRVAENRHWSFEILTGYYRESWGQTPTKGEFGFTKQSPYWYECGVRIPE